MAMTHRYPPCPRLSRLVGVALGAAALSSLPRIASAQVCFPTPVALPGLSGVPIWSGSSGTVRKELNEPRWAAAPQTAFVTDLTAAEGRYRVLVDPTFKELDVSFQAITDPNVPSNADVIYFGFTTDGTGGTTAKGLSINVPNSGTDPIDVTTNATEYDYDVATPAKWSSPGAPPWLKQASAWRSSADAAWGINFKIDLSAVGMSAGDFKVMLAMHKADEATPSLSVNLSTPDPSTNALLTGTLFVANPALWAPASAINASCVNGITLDGSQIGTLNVDSMGVTQPNVIDTADAHVNKFQARPTVPSTISPGPGVFQGDFFVADWGSIAASNAPWNPIPHGSGVRNGVAPSTDNHILQFNCSPNTTTTTCDMPILTGEKHQCVYVALKAAPMHNVQFTTATAYTNMWFRPLSTFSTPAKISVKGLKKVFLDDKPRDVYVYVYAKNMPAHGNKPIYLPTDKMAATRRFSETLAEPPVNFFGKPQVPGQGRIPIAKAGKSQAVEAPPTLPMRPLPRTGIGDLDLKPQQALSAVWPTYDVHVYYDSGKTVTIGGKASKQLVPMYPFTYYHSHEGPLFGFSHGFALSSGAVLKEIRPDVYLITIPSEGSANVVTSVQAHEEPKDPGQPPSCPTCPPTVTCPKPPPPVDKGQCGCRVPGRNAPGDAGALFGIAALGLALASRRREKRA